MPHLLYSKLAVAKISHDLAGILSAVSNCLDLLSEESSLDQETLSIAIESANIANIRLSFFRAAFGSDNALSGLDMTKSLLTNYVSSIENISTKFNVTWDVDKEVSVFSYRMILLGSLIALESMIKGGTLTICAKNDQNSLVISGEGSRILFDESSQAILLKSKLPETPKQISLAYLSVLAKEKGWSLDVSTTETSFVLKMLC